MLITKARHDREIAYKDLTIATLQRSARADAITIDSLDRTGKKYKALLEAANAELAPLKAIREKQLDNLRRHNAKRAEAARARELN